MQKKEKKRYCRQARCQQGASKNDGVEGSSAEDNKFEVIVRDTIGGTAFGVLAGIAFSTDHKIGGLWLSFISLASILHVPTHFLLKANPSKKRAVWSGYGVITVGIAVWFGFWTHSLAYPRPERSPGDLVEHTTVTYGQVEKLFPFGYVIIFGESGKYRTYQPPRSSKRRFFTDVDKIKPRPDFSKRTVDWSIELNWDEPATGNKGRGLRLGGITVGLEVGPFFLVFDYGDDNQPQPFVTTIGDNQQNPVFVLGFRIPDDTRAERWQRMINQRFEEQVLKKGQPSQP